VYDIYQTAQECSTNESHKIGRNQVDFGDPSHEVAAQAKRQATTDDLPETLTYEYEADEEIEF
jgi:hypothetical protein